LTLESLFETFYEDCALFKLIVTLSPVEICEDDGLSAVICGNCKLNAIEAYKFQQLCVNSDKSIRMLIDNQLPSDVIKTEDTDITNSDEFQSLETRIEETLDISLQNDVNTSTVEGENEFEIASIEEDFTAETDGDDYDDFDSSHDSEDSMSDSEKLNCSSCTKSFKSTTELEVHIKNRHQASSKKSKQQTASEDEETDDDDDDCSRKEVYICDLCPKSFKKTSLLARHIKTHDPKKRPFECKKCDKRFSSQVSLVRHDILHSDLVERSKINRPEAQDFVCVVCARSFKSPESLTSHIKAHKSKSVENQEYTCKLCHDTFPTFTDIVRHSKNHVENATHQCAICNKMFAGDELIDHFLRHKGELLM